MKVGASISSIRSPAAGTILKSIDGLPDVFPPDHDEENPAGNHVLIGTDDDKYILVAHMKQGTVAVAEGERVSVGTLLGRVGSSGRSEEPHLHIHCMNTLEENYPRQGNGVPMLLGGHYLVRNRLISNHGESAK